MKKYEFNVKIYGDVTLEVMANSKKEAKEMVNDLMEKISLEEIKTKNSPVKDLLIKKSNFISDISDRKVYERG